MITSYTNKAVKEAVQLMQRARVRKQLELFVAEGVKMYQEAPEELVHRVYISQRMEEELLQKCGEKLGRTGYEVVADEVFRRMSDTKSPQGILSVIRQSHYRMCDLVGISVENPLLLILEDIQDPGNLGTMFRAGEAAGISGIVMSGRTVDVYNPKTIRSTMGSVFRVPFLYTDDLHKSIRKIQEKGVRVYAAHLQAEGLYDSFSYEGGTAFLIGNEGNGLEEETAALADSYLKIPMEGKVESLNAAVASSVLLYEAYRQRRGMRTQP